MKRCGVGKEVPRSLLGPRHGFHINMKMRKTEWKIDLMWKILENAKWTISSEIYRRKQCIMGWGV